MRDIVEKCFHVCILRKKKNSCFFFKYIFIQYEPGNLKNRISLETKM